MISMIEVEGLSGICVVEDDDKTGDAMKSSVSSFKANLMADCKPKLPQPPTDDKELPQAPELLLDTGMPPADMADLLPPPQPTRKPSGISFVGGGVPLLPLSGEDKAHAAHKGDELRTGMSGAGPEDSKSTTAEEEAETPVDADIKEPKGTRNAYLFYANANRVRLQKENPSAGLGEISKLVGQAWKDLDDVDQAHYIELAAEDKKRYELELATFKAAGGVLSKEKKKRKTSEQQAISLVTRAASN